MSNFTQYCTSPNGLPTYSALPLDDSLNVLFIPRDNITEHAMKVCCAPNSVNVVNDCILWCEIPQAYINGTKGNGKADGDFGGGMGQCLRDNGRRTGIVGANWASAAPSAQPAIYKMSVLLLVASMLTTNVF